MKVFDGARKLKGWIHEAAAVLMGYNICQGWVRVSITAGNIMPLLVSILPLLLTLTPFHNFLLQSKLTRIT